ncbi:MAG: hypothetical protein HYY16_02595 [Planctomycetes bacterium]|nr:hypothetical protein [Planctomycetota bacterium]
MWTHLRIAGGVVFLIALFLRPLQWAGSGSAFQLAAHQHDAEAILVFLGSMALGATAALSTFFTRRVIEWLEVLLAILSAVAVVFFVMRYGMRESQGIRITWAGLTLVAGLLMIALGAHGRYRNAGRE